MKLFLLDLWHDLREKRLWPVAALLAAALVAVPLVVAKPAEEPDVAPPERAETREEADLKGLARVVLAQDKLANGSKLNLFDSGDPFSPPKSVLDAAEEDDTGAPVTGTSAGGDLLGGLSTPGGDGGTVSPGGGTTGGGGVTTPEPSEPQQKTTQFTYVIDVTFTHGNRRRKIKGMERLAMLPSQESPLLLFLGVDAKASNAVFLVDSRLQPSGEGTCKPRPEDCSFLYLGAGSMHLFNDENGESYSLRIDQIRRVKIRARSARARAESSRKARRGRRKRARAAVERRPFIPPLIADLVTVSSDSYVDSSSGAGRR